MFYFILVLFASFINVYVYVCVCVQMNLKITFPSDQRRQRQQLQQPTTTTTASTMKKILFDLALHYIHFPLSISHLINQFRILQGTKYKQNLA